MTSKEQGVRTTKHSDLRGKVVLITGGAKGLGAATAEQAARRGAHVAIIDVEAPGADHPAGPEVLAVKADVTDRDDLRAAVEQVVDRFGRLDVVVANAGVAARGRPCESPRRTRSSACSRSTSTASSTPCTRRFPT